MKLAVIGAGWAGLAAAIVATREGHAVTLFEATRQLGGRARSLAVPLPDGKTGTLDNGQHILIGAYRETLALMREVGVDPHRVLLRLPLTLRFPDGGGLALPDWPSPLNAAWGIAAASSWSWGDKLSLLSHAVRWQVRRFRCPEQLSVTQLCRGMGARVMRELVEPLCVAALNTPAERASGQVFLRVMRDALFGRRQDGWGTSDLLIPRVDLGSLFPDAAQRWLQAQGVVVRTGTRVRAIAPRTPGWLVDGEGFDAVLLACPPWDAERLVAGGGVAAGDWLATVRSLAYEAIATTYATGGPRLGLPMLSLRSDDQRPAQFVFDRSQLGGPSGLLAFVASGSQGDARSLELQVTQQAAALGWSVEPLKTVVEKRATFACTPGVRRPPMAIAAGLLACGDYVEGPYPSTLEGAVRSALAAAAALGKPVS